MRRLAVSVAMLAATILAHQAEAQAVRAPGAQPSQTPGFQATPIDPVHQALNTLNARLDALNARLDALEAAAGRQIIVIDQVSETADMKWPASSDNAPNNDTRSRQACQQALGDRFGRVLSRLRTKTGDQYFLSRVVCEARWP